LDPGSRIPDPKTATKERGIHKFHKIVNYFIFEMLKKKIWANFQRIIELFIQKIVTKLSKIWVWDPRSGIQGSDHGYRGSGSATLPSSILISINSCRGNQMFVTAITYV
jgi:hypothetical protein